MTFVPPNYIVPCDTCGIALALCSPRAGGRKYDIGDSYRCHACQDAAGDEPRYDERYAS